jgi:hypothetical protein
MLVSFSLVLSLLCGTCSGLEQEEITSYVVLTTQDAYPGHSILAAIYIKNNSPELLTIQYAGIHFDWMASDQFFGYDLSDDPVVLSSSADQFLDSISIPLPDDATSGEHSYLVGIDGLEGTEFFSWDSSTFTLFVKDPEQEEYDTLVIQVSKKVTASEGKNYQSSMAQSLLGQANTAYDQALAYADQNSWNEAVSMLNNALTYLTQADVEEQKYLADKSSQDILLITVGVAAVAIVAILAVLFLMKRSKTREISSQPQSSNL